MKALIYHQFGDTSKLKWSDWPKPSCPSDGVVVKVSALGLNPKDILLRKGKFRYTLARTKLPRLSGMDAAGTICEVGDQVKNFHIGDRITGMTNVFSGQVHAEYAVFKQGEIALVSDAFSLLEAAAIPLASLTALQALRDCGSVKENSRVLINGASGGVGHFAVVLAKHLKLSVDAVCGPKNIDWVRSLGADDVFNYQNYDIRANNHQYDCIFDVFGKYDRSYFLNSLKESGIYVSTVPKWATLLGELKSFLHIDHRTRLVNVQSRADDLQIILGILAMDKKAPYLDSVYTINEIEKAHQHIETRHTKGKVVINLDA